MRYILSLTMVAGLAFILACQGSTFSASADDNTIVEKEAGSQPTRNERVESVNTHEDDDAKRISIKDAKEAFDKGEALFVDTRSENSFVNEHIKGAVNIPASEMTSRYEELPKDKQLIFYCS